MSASWMKTVRDFWRERTRTLMVACALAVGIAGFTAVLSAYAVLTRELNRGYLATNPASAMLHLDRVDDALLAAVLENRAVGDAEARRMVTGRIQAGPAEWRTLVLFVVKDFNNIRMSRLVPQQGAWPPPAGEILIERDAFQVAKTKIGASVTVKTDEGIERRLRVAGSVHDVGQAQARMENIVYGYVTLDTLAELGEKPYLDRLSILVATGRLDERHIRRVADDVRKLVESRGRRVLRVDLPTPGKHPHADIMGLLLLAMSGFGFCILALGGILVVNLLTALMASEVRQIGIMKAVGGARGQIVRIYFGQALLLGCGAVALGLPAGVWGNRRLCELMAGLLNFDIASFAAPAWVYLLVAAVGIAAPLAAAAYPVLKGAGIPVRAALADFGVSSEAFGTGMLDRLLARIGGRFRPFLLALRNSFRRRARLALTVSTLAAGGLFFLSALNIRTSMIRTLDRSFALQKYDLSVTLSSLYPCDALERAARNTPGVARAEGWIVLEASLPVAGDSHSGARFPLSALPPQTGLLSLEIVEGRKLLPEDGNAIVLNTALAAKAHKKTGDSLELAVAHERMSWRVVGVARQPFSLPAAYIARGYLERRGGVEGMANHLRLALDRTDPASLDAVRESLDRSLDREGIRAVGSSSKADLRFAFDQHMKMIYVFLIVASLILAVVGGLGLAATMSLNVLERRREMGVLRAIGAPPRAVWFIVAAEAVVTSVMSWAIAALAAWPLSRALGDFMVRGVFGTALDFRFEPLGLAAWLSVSIFLGAGASLLPAWRASRMTVREALAYA
jgi:putative ABC transport system permease protein